MLQWHHLFSGNQVTPDAPAYILQAANMIVYDNLTREERAVIDAEDIFKQDILAREHFVFNQGYADGVKEALEAQHAALEAECAELKAQINNGVRALKARGVDTSAICKSIGLSAEEVAAL
jgi:hypothetical protein